MGRARNSLPKHYKPGPIIAYIGGALEIIQLFLASVQRIGLDQ